MINDPCSDEDRYTKTQFWVEADSYSKHSLWEKWHLKYNWEQICAGEMVTVGYLDNMPVNISVSWYYINGIRIGFYYACSQVIDYRIIDEWFKQYDVRYDGTRSACTDASNFVHCLHALKEFQHKEETE